MHGLFRIQSMCWFPTERPRGVHVSSYNALGRSFFSLCEMHVRSAVSPIDIDVGRRRSSTVTSRYEWYTSEVAAGALCARCGFFCRSSVFHHQYYGCVCLRSFGSGDVSIHVHL